MGLTVSGISKHYNGNTALDNLSFSVDEPGVFGLLGTNGAGKTTAIRIILGVIRPDSGQVRYNGQEFDGASGLCGYMPEERGIYTDINVRDQLVYFARLRGMSRRDAQSSADRWLERTGTMEYASVKAGKLSKGNQQKIQLIAAVIHSPPLIFLDEPFSGLDPINSDLFREIIDSLVSEGSIIVMSSHQMATVESYCRDIVIINHGRVLLEGNLARIKAGYSHSRLLVNTDADLSRFTDGDPGIELIASTPLGREFLITGDEAANRLLTSMVSAGVCPEKFEIRQPSLHEIFVEKVGGAR